MPLPDERPRQSVANLIGRFEIQNKRLSVSASSPSRSSSVVSHVTGDSTREDVKEKREWPPKSSAETEKPPIVLPSLSSRHIPPTLITQSSSADSGLTNKRKKDPSELPTEEVEVPLTAKALSASQRQAKGEPSSFLENWRKDLPSAQVDVEPEPTPTLPAPAQSQASLETPTPASAQKFVTPATPRTPNAKVATRTPPSAASKAPVSASSRAAAKTPLKSPASKQSLTPSSSQPLKPQHTGQSVASSATARRPLTKVPTTPASAKTPTRPEAVSRVKTPTSVRPKTPSTGLFAPTAASLARSRNAPPPVPTPIKKATLSSTSMDRLSKPTAASKARIASSPPTPASRPATTSTARTSTSTKSKAATSPSKGRTSQPVAGAAVAASVASIGLAATAAAITTDGEDEGIHDIAGNAQNGSSPELKASVVQEPIDETTEASEEAAAAVEEHSEDAHSEHLEDRQTGDSASIGSGEDEATPVSPSPAPEAEHISEEAGATQFTSVNQETKDDLEDIVNLLESVSITKPLDDTIADIPDEILEIPDEDEK